MPDLFAGRCRAVQGVRGSGGGGGVSGANGKDRRSAGILQCHLCGRSVTSLARVCVAIYHQPTMGYPRDWWDLICVLEHVKCAVEHDLNERGYSFPLQELIRHELESAAGWVTHLREKCWWANDREYELRLMYNMALRLTHHEQAVKVTAPQRNISTRVRALVMERDNFRCRRCGATAKERRLAVDHIVPVAKGGGCDLDNLQCLCDLCNLGKSDRDPHEHDHRPEGAHA